MKGLLFMTKKQRAFFKHAKAASEMSNFPKVHIGCIVTYGNKILSVGFNNTKSDPVQQRYNRFRNFDDGVQYGDLTHSLHAEIMALKQLEHTDIDFNRCEVWVYREKSDGSLGCCRPCDACLRYMKDLGITKLHYTTDIGYANETIVY